MSALKHLPSDLIEAILPFLPPKSLGRFKSVSKRWYSLISSPNFIKTHIRNYTKNNPNPTPTHLILDEEVDYDVYSVDMKQLNTQPTPATLTAKRMIFQEPMFGIIGSCNGLLLVIDKHHNLYLVNPTTQKTLKVLAGISNDETYRFGYDSSTDDYKVISISHTGISDSDSDTKSVRVYSLRNNSWNMLPNFSYKCDLCGPGELLLNNNLHWVVSSKRSTMTIATFSLASEQIHEIEFPDSINCIRGFRVTCSQLCSIGGKVVAVFCVGLSVPEFVYELWVMEEYGVPNSWTKLCILEIDIYPSLEFFVPVSNRDILFGSSDTEKIYIYNMDERRCTSVAVEGCPEGFMVIGTYVESLESPKRFR